MRNHLEIGIEMWGSGPASWECGIRPLQRENSRSAWKGVKLVEVEIFAV